MYKIPQILEHGWSKILKTLNKLYSYLRISNSNANHKKPNIKPIVDVVNLWAHAPALYVFASNMPHPILSL